MARSVDLKDSSNDLFNNIKKTNQDQGNNSKELDISEISTSMDTKIKKKKRNVNIPPEIYVDNISGISYELRINSLPTLVLEKLLHFLNFKDTLNLSMVSENLFSSIVYFHNKWKRMEIFVVDQHNIGVYIYQQECKEDVNVKKSINFNSPIGVGYPYAFSIFRNIKSLNISGILLNNFHHVVIQNMLNITELCLGPYYSAKIPPSPDINLSFLTKLKKLISLTIENCNLTLDGIRFISTLPRLRNLKLVRCKKFSEVDIEWIHNMNIQRLLLQNETCYNTTLFNLTSNSVKFLSRMKTLKELSLSGFRITKLDFRPSPENALTSFEVLNCIVAVDGFVNYFITPSLRRLFVDEYSTSLIDDSYFECLKFYRLNRLSIFNTQITCQIMKSLAHLNNRSVDIEFNGMYDYTFKRKPFYEFIRILTMSTIEPISLNRIFEKEFSKFIVVSLDNKEIASIGIEYLTKHHINFEVIFLNSDINKKQKCLIAFASVASYRLWELMKPAYYAEHKNIIHSSKNVTLKWTNLSELGLSLTDIAYGCLKYFFKDDQPLRHASAYYRLMDKSQFHCFFEDPRLPSTLKAVLNEENWKKIPKKYYSLR